MDSSTANMLSNMLLPRTKPDYVGQMILGSNVLSLAAIIFAYILYDELSNVMGR